LLDLSPIFLGLNSTNELAHEGYLVTQTDRWDRRQVSTETHLRFIDYREQHG